MGHATIGAFLFSGLGLAAATGPAMAQKASFVSVDEFVLKFQKPTS